MDGELGQWPQATAHGGRDNDSASNGAAFDEPWSTPLQLNVPESAARDPFEGFMATPGKGLFKDSRSGDPLFSLVGSEPVGFGATPGQLGSPRTPGNWWANQDPSRAVDDDEEFKSGDQVLAMMDQEAIFHHGSAGAMDTGFGEPGVDPFIDAEPAVLADPRAYFMQRSAPVTKLAMLEAYSKFRSPASSPSNARAPPSEANGADSGPLKSFDGRPVHAVAAAEAAKENSSWPSNADVSRRDREGVAAQALPKDLGYPFSESLEFTPNRTRLAPSSLRTLQKKFPIGGSAGQGQALLGKTAPKPPSNGATRMALTSSRAEDATSKERAIVNACFVDLPRDSLDGLDLCAAFGTRCVRRVPIANKGPTPVAVNVALAANALLGNTELSVSPTCLEIEPGRQRLLTVTFQPRAPSHTSSRQLRSVLEVDVSGSVLQRIPVNTATQHGPRLHIDRSGINFAGVSPNCVETARIAVSNQSAEPVQVRVSTGIECSGQHGDERSGASTAHDVPERVLEELGKEDVEDGCWLPPEEEAQAFIAWVGEEEGDQQTLPTSTVAQIPPHKRVYVWVRFAPGKRLKFRASLRLEAAPVSALAEGVETAPWEERVIPLFGYGGTARVSAGSSSVLLHATPPGLYAATVELHNAGERTAYVRASRVHGPGLQVSPGALTVPPGEKREVEVVYRGSHPPGSPLHQIELFWGDDLLRAKRWSARRRHDRGALASSSFDGDAEFDGLGSRAADTGSVSCSLFHEGLFEERQRRIPLHVAFGGARRFETPAGGVQSDETCMAFHKSDTPGLAVRPSQVRLVESSGAHRSPGTRLFLSKFTVRNTNAHIVRITCWSADQRLALSPARGCVLAGEDFEVTAQFALPPGERRPREPIEIVVDNELNKSALQAILVPGSSKRSSRSLTRPARRGVYFDRTRYDVSAAADGTSSEVSIKVANGQDSPVAVEFKLVQSHHVFRIRTAHRQVRLGSRVYVELPVKFTPCEVGREWTAKLLVLSAGIVLASTDLKGCVGVSARPQGR